MIIRLKAPFEELIYNNPHLDRFVRLSCTAGFDEAGLSAIYLTSLMSEWLVSCEKAINNIIYILSYTSSQNLRYMVHLTLESHQTKYPPPPQQKVLHRIAPINF